MLLFNSKMTILNEKKNSQIEQLGGVDRSRNPVWVEAAALAKAAASVAAAAQLVGAAGSR